MARTRNWNEFIVSLGFRKVSHSLQEDRLDKTLAAGAMTLGIQYIFLNWNFILSK